MMYGQMTAGSWIYIGTQGILQGTYETFASAAKLHFGGTLAGTITVTAGLGGMGGAQPLAITLAGGVALSASRSIRPASSGASRRATSTRSPTRSTTRSRAPRRPRGARRALSIGLLGNAAEVLPEMVRRGFTPDLVTDQTSAHDPRYGYVPVLTPDEDAAACATTTRTATWRACAPRWPTTCAPSSSCSGAAPSPSTTATTCAPRRGRPGSRTRSTTPASCRPSSASRSARGAAPSAGWRSPATPPTSPPPTARCSSSSPTTSACRAGSATPASGSPSRASPRASAGSATASATAPACASTRWCASGEVSAPIVIGRDHLDAGSVASPYRETEAMRDGSDAVSDWPLLNFALAASSGAAWVSFHHGGGVGMGYSQHAGLVAVADGSDEAETRLACASSTTRRWAWCATPTPATRRRCASPRARPRPPEPGRDGRPPSADVGWVDDAASAAQPAAPDEAGPWARSPPA
jgi:urocanate hydratase